MKNLIFSLLILTAIVLVGCGQKKAEVIEDIITAAPDKAVTVFENEFVHVARFSLKPGESLPLHKGGPRAVYSLSDYQLKWTENNQISDKIWQKGDVHWHDSLPHAAENIGKSDAIYLTVTRTGMTLPDAGAYNISQDAAQLDTIHSKMIFENDFVRIITVEIPPGEAQPRHDGSNRLIYSLSGYQIKYTSDQTDTLEATFEPGQAHWHSADQHAIENIGKTSAQFLIFEFKK